MTIDEKFTVVRETIIGVAEHIDNLRDDVRELQRRVYELEVEREQRREAERA